MITLGSNQLDEAIKAHTIPTDGLDKLPLIKVCI